MSVVVVTGAAGLVGSEAVRLFHEKGFEVAGLDNDMRRTFFGEEASTRWSRRELEANLARYTHFDVDIRDAGAVDRIFESYGRGIAAVIHAAAQPSHDWAAREPFTDFSVNATGTLVLLEATRKHCPDACFVFCSTNKVYGDGPNQLPLVERPTRWELSPTHPFSTHGIDETMSLDRCTHSLFGVSKASADLMVQEYGRYFGMKTGAFRGGCITGAGHSGTELHGFLSYLMRCCMEKRPYTIYGYKGKQVRDNIHAADLVGMFWEFFQDPRPGEVYNAGGGRDVNCSVLEAIALCEEVAEKKLVHRYEDQNRTGDHVWYVSDIRRFREHYPGWSLEYDLPAILEAVHQGWRERL